MDDRDPEGNNSVVPGDSDKPVGPRGVAWSTYEDQKEQFQRKMCDAAKKYGFLQKLQGSSGDIRLGDTVPGWGTVHLILWDLEAPEKVLAASKL